MNLSQLGILYILLGVGCVVALLVMRREQARILDLALLAIAWPLYAPFILARDMEEADFSAPRASAPSGGQDLLDALRRAGGAPLAQLLPDVATGQRLAARLDVATRRVDEIDALLAQDQYSERLAVDRQRQLLASGDARAAAMVDSRLQIIRRLRKMREQFGKEINQISELLTQLRIQAEVVRIAGASDDDTRELVGELVARIQGLDELLDEELV
jgi:hypothetical protein